MPNSVLQLHFRFLPNAYRPLSRAHSGVLSLRKFGCWKRLLDDLHANLLFKSVLPLEPTSRTCRVQTCEHAVIAMWSVAHRQHRYNPKRNPLQALRLNETVAESPPCSNATVRFAAFSSAFAVWHSPLSSSPTICLASACNVIHLGCIWNTFWIHFYANCKPIPKPIIWFH